MGKIEKRSGKRLNKKAMAELLIDFFQQNPDKEFTTKRLFSDLGLKTHPLKMLCLDVLSDLLFDEYVREVSRGRFMLCNIEQTLEGTFQRKSSGRNTFVPDDGSEPVSIAERNSGHALDGDRVKVALFAKRRGRGKEGEVIVESPLGYHIDCSHTTTNLHQDTNGNREIQRPQPQTRYQAHQPSDCKGIEHLRSIQYPILG